MATYDITNRELKVVVQVNTGTTESPTLKNRPIGTGYIINPDGTMVDNEKAYQAAQYFGALQIHPVTAVWAERKAEAIREG